MLGFLRQKVFIDLGYQSIVNNYKKKISNSQKKNKKSKNNPNLSLSDERRQYNKKFEPYKNFG